MKYKSVLLEVQDADIKFKNPVTVLFDFDASKPIGKANVYHKEGKLFADIECANVPLDTSIPLYPAIGFVKKGGRKHLYNIGLSPNGNVDSDIPALKASK